MRRREFLGGLGGAAVAWPHTVRAQRVERLRRVGVLTLYPESDPRGQARARAFQETLAKRGWTAGRNIEINYHWGVGDPEWVRSAIAQLVKSEPEVIVSNGGQTVQPLQRATRTIPVIFIGGADPRGDGVVQSLARPGGNLTGFMALEPSQGAKLLALLKEFAPRLKRVAVMIRPDNVGAGHLADAAAAAAAKLGVASVTTPVREEAEIEALLGQLATEPDSGLTVPPDPSINTSSRFIVNLAARYKLPAIYANREIVAEGGLIAYGVDYSELFRQAAGYVDRVLRGERPGDLPVQAPTKFELGINLKTAKALGLTVPQSLLATADEVIE
jgi:putative ABC transport system substrate-binding protein